MKDKVWSDTTKRLTHMLSGGDPHEGVLEQALVGNPLEDWAWAAAEQFKVDLSLVLPMALVIPSACAHGGVAVEMVLEGGVPLRRPITLQYVGLAESGVGKSTLLNQALGIIEPALEAGTAVMADWVVDRLAESQGLLEGAPVGAAPAWGMTEARSVYGAGTCSGGTVIGSSTQEALRNGLAENGSHQVVASAESDLLEEISRYSKDGGSVSIMLHGWDGENIRVRRVKSGGATITADRASLPMILLMQPDAFEEHAASSVFTVKGLLHRWFITHGASTADGTVSALDWDLSLLDPATVMSSPLWVARDALLGSMTALSESTAAYRASMAARAAWVAGNLSTTGMPRPALLPRRVLHLADDDARRAYLHVQDIRHQLHVATSGNAADPDSVHGMFNPLAVRYADHVMRVASAYTLAMDPLATVLRAEEIRDAGCRVMPWMWGHWRDAMGRRTVSSIEVTVAGMMGPSNPKGRSVTPEALVLKAIGGLTMKNGTPLSSQADEPSPPFAESVVIKRVLDSSRALGRAAGAKEHVREVLNRLAVEGDYVEELARANNGGRRFRLTVAGVRWAAHELK